MSHEVIFALDIGTTKVCMVAGKKNEFGRVEILGVGNVPSTGVLRGAVSNLEKTAQCIKEAKQLCEKDAGIKAKKVHVGIAGRNIKSLIHDGLLTRRNHNSEISKEDVKQLINDMNQLVLPPGDKIIHIIPQEYVVDGERGIMDPVGMAGVRLEGIFHIITAQSTMSKNILNTVAKTGMEVDDITLEPIASAAAVLSEEEKQAGVALLDIGGGTSDLCIYHEGILRKTAIIPFGGNIITEDIKHGCKVMDGNAELLKVKYGKALTDIVDDNRYYSIKGLKGHEPKIISDRNLASVIEARVTEIFEFVNEVIQKSGYHDKLVAGLVITGGGSMLGNIKDLSEYLTGLPTRLGMPIDILAHGYSQEICHPTYSTALGLLLHGISKYAELEVPEEEVSVSDHISENERLENEQAEHDEMDSTQSRTNLWRQLQSFFGAQNDSDI